jgi:hypothetical protein
VDRIVQTDDLACEQFAVSLKGLRNPANVVLCSYDDTGRLPWLTSRSTLLLVLQLHATDVQQKAEKENV